MRSLGPLHSVLLAAIVAAALAFPAGAAADQSVAGQWRVEFATPLGQRGANLTIAQAGARLSGHVIDEYGEYAMKGRFVDGQVTIAWSVPEHGKMLQITVRGTLDGSVITGTAKLGDVGEGAFTARRTGDAGDR